MHGTQRDAAIRLASLGFASLFLELALIRYLAGSVWNLGYFPNLVLLAAFLGMGCGFLLHARFTERASLCAFLAAPVVLLALVLLIPVARPAVPGFDGFEGDVGGELFFTSVSASEPTRPWPFLLCFAGVAALFALISQRTAKLFRCFPPLRAYSLDILGSCLGITAFMAASFLWLPAWTWFLALALALLPAAAEAGAPWRWAPVGLLALVAAAVAQQDTRSSAGGAAPREALWSPYQKVELKVADDRPGEIFVNGISHQLMWRRAELQKLFYAAPYEHRRRDGLPPCRRVLIIGSGSGNDVATGLLAGVREVDAVEIDPVLADLGKRHHPERPYDDPRVSLVVDDGRAFMAATAHRYDLIVFALTDSLVKVSPMAQLRLENYLFTIESVARAYALLEEGGDLVLYNYYRREWLRARLAAMLGAATGCEVRETYRAGALSILTVRRRGAGVAPPAAAAAAADRQLPVDDWPFLYLQQRRIPDLYRKVMGGYAALLAILLAVLARARGSGESSLGLRLGFMLMGAAFLLLETKSVIQFSLLFGTTWYNSSLVFLGILVLVLLANRTVMAFGHRVLFGPAFAMIVATGLLGLVLPLSALLAVESGVLRFILASLLTFSPIFFANILFSSMFRGRAMAEQLFGWNLLGAALGGILEYASMALGYQALGLIVVALYTATFGLFFSHRRGALPLAGAGEG